MDNEKPNYYTQVFEVTQLIPHGRISTYGTIANYLCLGSARMVGWALNSAIHLGDVPAHRVVNRKGELSGRAHFKPTSKMQELLEAEGVEIVDHKVVNFDKYFWSPIELLK